MPSETPLDWIGSSKKDLLTFPEPVIGAMGYALGVAQLGGKHPHAKPWKGEGGGCLRWWRAMMATPIARFTLHRILGRFAEVIYVLHAFQKKSTKGIQTSKTDVAMIKARLKLAQQDYETRNKAND